ncbi:Hsp70 family protein [Insolitispirillum peregrinum]|uniref:Hypothetical chaperone protein n=1 Tax=Insolitispirillum peregrinum TaxID=80876 RepID=A0A1N7PNN1_9PROT|nr:Hsp70 family protein [Insolitispirillum peregrinum]SIT12067.1 hypothetical chaperone protein [Insolitispirillum peregrinum]
MFVGIDFGTTNSAIALLAAGQDDAHIVPMPPMPGGDGEAASTLRSLLAFDGKHRDDRKQVVPLVGQEAIAAYLEDDTDCRLLQSFKSYLTSRLFTGASLFNVTYSLEDLIALMVTRLRTMAEAQGAGEVRRVVAGRPVRFVAEDGASEEDYAVSRLRDAFARAGVDELELEYEPIAAAYYYERGLSHDETVLVADFGGGTSDFCLMRLGPGRDRSRPRDAILGTGGVGNAGDALDRRIVDNGLAEAFGKGITYRSDGKELPVPSWLFGKFSRWHHISFLNTAPTRRMLRDIQRHTDDPEPIENLLALIEENLGYHLFRSVERVKVGLSRQDSAEFLFDHGPISLRQTIRRADFERWIAPELEEIEGCLDRLLADTGVRPEQVDRVFMTGGTSLVPAVRGIFARRFGEARLSSGGEFVSVATGLAYRAREVFGG